MYQLIPVRAIQTRIFALRGQDALVAKAIDWLAATSRETGGLEDVVDGLGSAHSGAPRSGRTRPRSYCSRARGDPGARDQEY
ncbi:MAG: hypothetical protein ACXWZF_06005 [Actinomycetota bacterium]